MATYEIVIRNETAQDTPVNPVTTPSKSETSSPSATQGEKYAAKLAKRIVSVGTIVHTADQIISHQHSMISLTTGAQEYGQRASYMYNKGSSFIKSVGMGAYAGYAATGGNPAGAAAGAAVAALLQVGSFAMNYFMKSDEIATKQALEDVSIRMRGQRATISGRRYSNITEF